MGCSKCGKPAIINQDYSGLHLCKQHFREDLLHKAKKTVRQHNWLIPGDHFVVALSGGPVSCALINFMQLILGERKDVSLTALTIGNSGSVITEKARSITSTSGITWDLISQNDENIADPERCVPIKAINKSPFQSHLLVERQISAIAEQSGFNSLVMGYSLEDHAEWTLWNIISGNAPKMLQEKLHCVRIIRPFMHIPEKELILYTRLFLGENYVTTECREESHAIDPIREILTRFGYGHPGVPYALVNIGEQITNFNIGPDYAD
jgi:tRNA(Ile)-lysidine synthase TilS/MesJ